MNTQANQPPDLFRDAAQTANAMMFILRVWTVSLEVFIRRGMGARYLGWNAVGVFVLIPIYCAFWERYNLAPMMWFLMAYVLMLVKARASSLSGGSDSCHSYYNGYPSMVKASLRSEVNELRFKQFREPLVVAMLGAALYQFNQPLGSYVIIGAVCLFLQATIGQQLDNVRLMDMNDAMVEQNYYAEQFRSKYRR